VSPSLAGKGVPTPRPAKLKGGHAERRVLGLNRQQLPGPEHTLELMLSTIAEVDTRPDNEVLDHSGDQYLPPETLAPRPWRRCDGQTAEVVASDLAFASVEPRPELHAELSSGLDNALSTADGRGRKMRPRSRHRKCYGATSFRDGSTGRARITSKQGS
jgi:hypothetical protein